MEPKENDNGIIARLAVDANRLRDIFVMIGAISYVFGLLVWAIYASRENMVVESISIFDIQYFVAGLVPALSLASAFVVGKYVKSIPFVVSGTIAVIVAIASLIITFSTLFWGWGIIISLLIIPIHGALSVFVETQSKPGTIFGIPRENMINLIDKLLKWPALVVLAILLIFVFVLYSELVYPNLPQSFGGAYPRCAFINIAKDKLGITFQSFDQGYLGPPIDGVVSIELIVFHATSDMLYLRPLTPLVHSPYVYELKRTAVDSIAWSQCAPEVLASAGYR